MSIKKFIKKKTKQFRRNYEAEQEFKKGVRAEEKIAYQKEQVRQAKTTGVAKARYKGDHKRKMIKQSVQSGGSIFGGVDVRTHSVGSTKPGKTKKKDLPPMNPYEGSPYASMFGEKPKPKAKKKKKKMGLKRVEYYS